MDQVLQVALPFVVALGSGVLSFIVIQARMQVQLSRERETRIETQAVLYQHHRTAEERIKATEAEARRKALDEFLSDVRVEERHYFRELQSPAHRRRLLVLQERIFFRNIPLSNWVEHEMVVEAGSDLGGLIKTGSAFVSGSLPSPSNGSTKLLR